MGLCEMNANDPRSPWSKQTTQARAATFTNWDIIDIQQMAEAGFVFSPDAESSDMAECLYCGLKLDGWEQQDDPRIEHLKRNADCLFFSHSVKTSNSRRKKAPTQVLVPVVKRDSLTAVVLPTPTIAEDWLSMSNQEITAKLHLNKLSINEPSENTKVKEYLEYLMQAHKEKIQADYSRMKDIFVEAANAKRATLLK